ncbi:WD40 repeat-like protein [Athelia psychrophila]|uniref:WD40 repeat-like protein n=1 Tax=Athelia psychrophila TaxID=1759441 RepID=A0A166C742_9AGAM|nr:WD40 repeat-like protein [Fibularhizoctonia sp. CBS 109695]
MAFAESRHLDARKSTFNDIQGSQNTYYINNFFTHPQWDEVRPSTESTPPTTPELLAQEWFFDRPESKTLQGPQTSSPINSISFSHDGKWVVCGSARLLFFEWQAGEWHFADYPKESFREAKNVSSVALFPNDSVIVCAAGNKIQMWHAVKGKEVAKAFDMGDKVHSISASPDGRHFVSGSARGELCICDVRDRRRVATIKVATALFVTSSGTDIYAVAFSPNGQVFVVGGAGGLNVYSYRP